MYSNEMTNTPEPIRDTRTARRTAKRSLLVGGGVLAALAIGPLMASAATQASGCPDGTYQSWTESYDPPAATISISNLPVTYLWVDTTLGRFLIGDGTPMNNETVNVSAQVGAPASKAGFCKGTATTTTPPTTAPPTTAPPTTAPPTTAPPTTAPPTTAPPTTAPPTTAPPTTTTQVAVNPPTTSLPSGGVAGPPDVAPPVTGLPETGASPVNTALLAVATLGTGLLLIRASRRSV